MPKRNPFLFFIILLALTPLPRADALGIGPPSFEMDLQMDGSNSTKFFITSDGLSGELIVGMEDLPFRIEPLRINMSSGDANTPVELTFYGNATLDPGVYEGKVTFLAMTGGNVAVGIKIKAKINLVGELKVSSLMSLERYAPYATGGIILLAIIIFVRRYSFNLVRRSG